MAMERTVARGRPGLIEITVVSSLVIDAVLSCLKVRAAGFLLQHRCCAQAWFVDGPRATAE
jgi:hypothetical protein